MFLLSGVAAFGAGLFFLSAEVFGWRPEPFGAFGALDHGFRIFLAALFVAAGSGVVLLKGAELVEESRTLPLAAFVRECFVRGNSALPAFAVRLLVGRGEVLRRETVADNFLAMAANYLTVAEHPADKGYVSVSDEGNKELGVFTVRVEVLRRIGRGLAPVLPQFGGKARVALEAGQWDTVRHILSEAFGLVPAPLGLSADDDKRPPALPALYGESVKVF